MSRGPIASSVLLIVAPGAHFAQGKGSRLWNLTSSNRFRLSALTCRKKRVGPNQTVNDKDNEVDHDERLRITGVAPGRYDAKVGHTDAKQWVVRDIEIRADAVFSITDKDLKDCNK